MSLWVGGGPRGGAEEPLGVLETPGFALAEIEEAETNEGVLALLTEVLDKLMSALSRNLIGCARGLGPRGQHPKRGPGPERGLGAAGGVPGWAGGAEFWCFFSLAGEQ